MTRTLLRAQQPGVFTQSQTHLSSPESEEALRKFATKEVCTLFPSTRGCILVLPQTRLLLHSYLQLLPFSNLVDDCLHVDVYWLWPLFVWCKSFPTRFGRDRFNCHPDFGSAFLRAPNDATRSVFLHDDQFVRWLEAVKKIALHQANVHLLILVHPIILFSFTDQHEPPKYSR